MGMFPLEVPLGKVKTINHIPGWCDGRMMKRLKQLASGIVVNIGAWKGRSCAALAQSADIVWAIDHWQGSPGEVRGPISTDHKQADNPLSVYWEFCQYMGHFGLLGTKVFPLTGNSPELARLFDPNSLDLVFLDGGHDYLSVWNDLSNWTGRVKGGGILCGDDFNWDGVFTAINRFHEGYASVFGLGNLHIEIDGKFWWCRRGS